MRNSVCLLMVLCLLLAGCQPSGATVLPVSITATSQPASIHLTPCNAAGGSVAAECGDLLVPEDRANPGGRMLALKVIVVRAKEQDPAPDPLFYVAGGPGDAATQAGIVANVNGIFLDVNARRDVVFLDQRGTNDQHRLTCDPVHFSTTEVQQQQIDDWIKSCIAGLDGDPRLYTTAEAMRDLDAARAALGYDRINLYGISYGVAAIQVYMRMFPEHVRAAVLDHGTALDLPFAQALPRASQAALDQIFTYCQQDAKCRASFPDIRGDWQKVLARVAKGPVTTSYMPAGADTPVVVTADGLAQGIHTLMFKTGSYAIVPYMIHKLAANEDWTAVVKTVNEHYGSSGEPEPLLLMKNTIFCFEPAWGFDSDAIARLNAGSYFRDLEVKIAQSQQQICAALPKPGPDQIYGPGKPAPLSALMLNSRIDPQNPPANMEAALKEFTRSRMVIEPTEGHDTSGSSCRWAIITHYIQQGSVDELDTTCMQNQKPSFVTGT